MGDVLEFLKGKKTYVLAVAGAVVMGLWMAGVLDQEAADALLAMLGFGSIAALRAGIQKSGPPTQ